MRQFFRQNLSDVPLVWIDTETTGVNPGADGVVQLGLARFEGGECRATRTMHINPGRPIPAEASAIHGITDADVEGAPTLAEAFEMHDVRVLIEGAQPCAYNAPFDSAFMPRGKFPHDWPWLDALTLVRVIDRFVKGSGRHKLEVACQRHGVRLDRAHDAGADAKAAGELFQVLIRLTDGGVPRTLGPLLAWFEQRRWDEWYRFNEWLSLQPPR